MKKKSRRHTFWWMLLCVVVLCTILICALFVSHGKSTTNGRNPFSIMTYNTHRMGNFEKPNKNRVIQYLLRSDVDVLCLQEVEVYKDAEFLTLYELKQSMKDKYPYSYIDFSVYNKRRQFGNVVFSKYPLIDKQSIDYPSRSNISSRCDMTIGDDTIRLIVNHLESNRFDNNDLNELDTITSDKLKKTALKLKMKWNTARIARHKQARRVHEEIEQSPYPVVVVGDFNDIPFSYTYLKIRNKLQDCFLATSWFKLGNTFEKYHIAIRIDYILCSHNLIPQRCDVDCVNHSDHYPVIATIAIE